MKYLVQRLMGCIRYAMTYFFTFPLPPVGVSARINTGTADTATGKKPTPHTPEQRVGASSPLSFEVTAGYTSALKHSIAFHGHNPQQYEFRFVEDMGDWSMRKEEGSNVVEFNTTLANQCSPSYYLALILHETYHLLNGLPNKEDAKLLKSVFHPDSMLIIDIEADLATYQFLHYWNGTTHEEFMKILYEGQDLFRESRAFPKKLERWWGTLVSTYNYSVTGGRCVFVPVFSCVPLDSILYFLVISPQGISLQEVPFSTDSLGHLYEMYQRGHEHSFASFCSSLSHVLKQVIDSLSTQLH